MALLTYTGRKSGQAYTLPISYLREGKTLRVLSAKDRVWWRNLRAEDSIVSLKLRGGEIKASALVAENQDDVVTRLQALIEQEPRYAKYLKIATLDTVTINTEAWMAAALERVVITLKLLDS